MQYKPQNVARVTDALVEQLKAALINVEVSRADEFNEDPGLCPWVGVYRDTVRFETKTVGYGMGARDQHIELVVAVQQSDASSGQACEDRLEELLASIGGAILDDVTLRGTVRNVESMETRYADYKKVGGSFMQTAVIYLTVVVSIAVVQN